MSCCAVGCQNRNSVNSDLKFYRIPADNNSFNANRRRRWLQAIRRSDWNKDLIKNATSLGHITRFGLQQQNNGKVVRLSNARTQNNVVLVVLANLP